MADFGLVSLAYYERQKAGALVHTKNTEGCPCAHSIIKFFLWLVKFFAPETSAPSSPGNTGISNGQPQVTACLLNLTGTVNWKLCFLVLYWLIHVSKFREMSFIM